MAVKINGNSSSTAPGFAGGDGDTGLHTTNDQIQLVTNSTNAVTVDASQRVGIGTSTPNELLEVRGTENQGIRLTSTAGSGEGANLQWYSMQTGDNKITAEIESDGSGTGGNLFFKTRSTAGVLTDRMVIDNSGNVGIGTSPFAKLQVNTGTNENLWVGSLGGSGAGVYLASVNDAASANTPMQIGSASVINFAISGTERMRIKSDGTVATAAGFGIGNITNAIANAFYIASSAITGGAGDSTLKYNTTTGRVTYDTSSRLVKEQISDCPYGIEELKQLQPRKYFRTDDQKEEIGFVADEMVQIMPEFVPLGPKSVITKNEEDTEEIPLGVNYEKLTAVLTKALQEAIAAIETLETINASFEARISALEGGN